MRPTHQSSRRPSHQHPHQQPKARKRFGQHFLEPAWVARLVDAIAPQPDETILEIGPGRGAMTLPLAKRAGRVIAVEIDHHLATALATRAPENVEIIERDFLAVDLAALLAREATPIRVAANLPYNVASPIIFALLHAARDGQLIRDAWLMVQSEVADRITAQPGDDAYGAMAVQVARLADAERRLTLPAGAFRPPPKVISAVVRLAPRPSPVDVGNPDRFEAIVRGVFQNRRKTMANALDPVATRYGLVASDALTQAGVDGRKRPEELALPDFAALARAML